MKEYYFLGFDQGLANSGICVLKIKILKNNKIKNEIIYHKWVKTSSKINTPERLVTVYNELREVIKKYPIKAVACEHLWKNNINKTTGRDKSAGMMTANMTSSLIMLLAGQYKLYFKSYVPSSIKKLTTGSGLATKEDMIKKVLKKYKIKEKISEHEADAICIATAIGIDYLKMNKIIK